MSVQLQTGFAGRSSNRVHQNRGCWLVMLMCGQSSIRDVIAFPKTQRAACLLTSAPSETSKDQLDELNLKVKPIVV